MSARAKQKGVARDRAALFWNLLGYGLLAVFIALILTLVYGFATMGNTALVVVLSIIGIGTVVVFALPQLYPIRWMVPGLAFVLLLVVYPIYFTVANSFTNYGDGHLYAKQQSIRLITARKFVPPDALTYRWEVMQGEDGRYALWLTREVDGALEVVFAPEGDPIRVVEGAASADAPAEFEGFRLLSGSERTIALGVIQNAVFGEGDDTVGIRNRREAARPLKQRFVYDPEADTITDISTGTVYIGNDETGFFEPVGGGDPLAPGFIINVGLANFARFINDPGLRGPLIDIFIWTVVFAAGSVLSTFALGLLMALILNSPDVIGRKVIQSLLIIPYAIPAVISIMVWRALLNDNFGLINRTLIDMGILTRATVIPWLTDASWAKISILLVNLWLGYPYMMLISSGALQAIPSDVYEAAAVDGATPWQTFRQITLPLLLVTVGPLLIASFTFNFNNFLLIDALTQGNPPIPGSPVQAGYTDILISYTYRLAFGNRGADYGYASAITLVIFALVALVTVFQTRFNNQWERVSDNG
jgi:ABC-type sugar transport system permease subunit